MQVSSRTDEINAGCHDRESIVLTAVYMHITFYACTNLWLRKLSTAKKVHAWMHSSYRPSCRRRYRLLTESYDITITMNRYSKRVRRAEITSA